MLETERWLACLQIDDEPQSHTSSQRQLCLSEAKLFASRPYVLLKYVQTRMGDTWARSQNFYLQQKPIVIS